MKKYEKITMLLILFEDEDVITGSMTDENSDGIYDGGIAEPDIWG